MKINQLLSFLSITGLIVGCSSGSGSNISQSEKRSSQPLAVEAVILEPQNLVERIEATGTLIPNEEVELKTEISGRVIGISFTEGSRVARGRLLVKLDDSDLKAQLSKLKVQEEYGRQDSTRQAELIEVGATTQEVYDAALNRLKTTQADIRLTQVQIDKTEIRSPFSGIIGLRQISEGSYVTPATTITNIQEIDPIKIEFKVPEKYVSRIKRGMDVSYTITSSDKSYTASIYAIEPKIDIDTRTVAVRALSANPAFELLPGAFAEIEVILNETSEALLTPSQTIIPELNGQVLYLYKGGKVVKVNVEIGVRNEKTIQLTKGVQPLDTVITTGLLQVKDGMPIEIKNIIELQTFQP